MNFSESRRTIVSVSSFGGLIFFAWHFYDLYCLAFEVDLSSTNIFFRMGTMLFLLPMLIPALLGVFYFLRSRVEIDKRISAYYGLYLLLVLFCVYILFTTSHHPVSAGLPILVVVIPLSVFISLLLVFKMKI